MPHSVQLFSQGDFFLTCFRSNRCNLKTLKTFCHGPHIICNDTKLCISTDVFVSNRVGDEPHVSLQWLITATRMELVLWRKGGEVLSYYHQGINVTFLIFLKCFPANACLCGLSSGERPAEGGYRGAVINLRGRLICRWGLSPTTCFPGLSSNLRRVFTVVIPADSSNRSVQPRGLGNGRLMALIRQVRELLTSYN